MHKLSDPIAREPEGKPTPAAMPVHLRGLPQWALLAIVAAAFVLGTLSVGLSWLEAHAARQRLAFGADDVQTLAAIAHLAPGVRDEALLVHALNTMVHLKGITNYQSLGVLAIGAGAAFIAIGFALFLIGADGAFKLQFDGQADLKLGLYATAPGLLCFTLAALLIALGATRRHEMVLGHYEASRTEAEDRPTAVSAAPASLLASLCVDRQLPRAVSTQMSIGSGRTRAIAPKGKAWVNGSTILVAFLDGDAAAQNFVRETAALWSRHANVAFKFDVATAEADLRISFVGPARWSYIGTDARAVPVEQPTMNLGGLGAPPFAPELRGVVLHQFGHALGLRHEHAVPPDGMRWDEAAVLRLYAGPPNRWTEVQTRSLFIAAYSIDQMEGTQPDPDSIMRVPIPVVLAANSRATHWNIDLSALDKEMIGGPRWYPRPAPPSPGR